MGIIKNHAFVDGNKRTGLAVIIALCKINNIFLPDEDKLYDAIMDVAEDNESSWTELYERFNLKLKLICELTTLDKEIYN